MENKKILAQIEEEVKTIELETERHFKKLLEEIKSVTETAKYLEEEKNRDEDTINWLTSMLENNLPSISELYRIKSCKLYVAQAILNKAKA